MEARAEASGSDLCTVELVEREAVENLIVTLVLMGKDANRTLLTGVFSPAQPQPRQRIQEALGNEPNPRDFIASPAHHYRPGRELQRPATASPSRQNLR